MLHPTLSSHTYIGSTLSLAFQLPKGESCVFELILPPEYPFLAPTLRVQSGRAVVSPYDLRSLTLEDLLAAPWSPHQTFCDLLAACERFLNGGNIAVLPQTKPLRLSAFQTAMHHVETGDLRRHSVFLIFSIAFCIRFAIGLSEYSGSAGEPEYGDFEVHRHWMELAVNSPTSQWYEEQEGAGRAADHPPLCMYMHYAIGIVLKQLIPKAVKPKSSRGFESDALKLFMRLSAIALDLGLLCSGIVFFVRTFYKRLEQSHQYALMMLGMNVPCLLLIDHGHFQYNCVMLGLSLWSFIFLLRHQFFAATLLFVFSVNFKQMGLYYLPSIAVFVVSRIWNTPTLVMRPASYHV